MPKPPEQSGATALAMARAILGDAVRIVGARLYGDVSAPESGDDGPVVLAAGTRASGTTVSSHIDIDFIPATARLLLGLKFSANEIPIGSDDNVIRDGVSIWVNGFPIGTGASATRIPRGHLPDLPVQTTTVSHGFELGLVADLSVSARKVNTIRIATAALGAAFVFSSLAVKAIAAPNFFLTDDEYDVPKNQSVTVDPTANDVSPGQSIIFITEINGVAVDVGDTVTLATGETITINEDGTITITADGDLGTVTFDYSASYGMGNAKPPKDATVTLNTVPCFVAGTMIRTDRGDVPVERLKKGDLVQTCDDGLQPIRWIGQRTLPAQGPMAPVRIARGAFGDHQTLMVSPLHRILVRSVHADLLFGSSEVLIAAKDLVDGIDVCQIEGGQVHYVHLLFDRHQVVWSEGLETESFLPGSQTTHCFEETTVAEICEIFPELDPKTGAGYGPAARPALKAFEAKLLAS
ncbi:MAG: 2,3,4,5-tetrahydropyridine-2,6-carboxylate N-succinyltransferase [Silicimonas sp.]|nr:2,3,4,5-tetrahydropyridine-2,6-carboxylate N-succinyltransferase [Silicimonas sp.]